jgi:hypothetical protein
MKKQISPQIMSLTFAVLVICFVIGFYAFAAWQEPTQSQPGGNVPPPLNAGSSYQIKTGALRLGGLTVDNDTLLAVSAGNVGIGTTSPQAPAPNNQTGNLDANDVYLRSIGKWASQAGGTIKLSNCAWTAWTSCNASGGGDSVCPAGKVAIGVSSQGCTSGSCDDITRCEHNRVNCCNIGF